MRDQTYFKVYLGLLALSLLLGVSAILTLIPAPQASWPNVLGYKSLCTFAPIATVIPALLAETVCIVRGRLFGPRRGMKRSWIGSIIVAAVLAGTLFFSVPAYIKAKTDAVSSVSEDAAASTLE